MEAKIDFAIKERDYDFIVKIIREICDRIKRLVPNNKSFCKRIDSHVDIELIDQMLKNNAYRDEDFYYTVNAILSYIRELQAPVDDMFLDSVQKRLDSLDGTLSWAQVVSSFVVDIHMLIYIIEQRKIAILQDPVLVQMIKNLD